jgi:hypothetical protein
MLPSMKMSMISCWGRVDYLPTRLDGPYRNLSEMPAIAMSWSYAGHCPNATNTHARLRHGASTPKLAACATHYASAREAVKTSSSIATMPWPHALRQHVTHLLVVVAHPLRALRGHPPSKRCSWGGARRALAPPTCVKSMDHPQLDMSISRGRAWPKKHMGFSG